MAALHNVGAVAPGPVTPTSDNAREQAGAEGGQAHRVSLDCAGDRHVWQSALPELCLAAWSVALALVLSFGGQL